MKYIIGNWKSNMTYNNFKSYVQQINTLKTDIAKITVGISVPHIFLLEAEKTINHPIYSQDCEAYKFGSNTGRISYEHLKDININHAIIGHSEQRRFNDNTNEIINTKLTTLLNNDFNVILCIGEPLDIYEENKTIEFLQNQIGSALKNVDIKKLNNLVIAYEPIWAIGTNKIPSNDYIQNALQEIKQYVEIITKFKNIPTLYGGSVNLSNIDNLKTIVNLDGFLIGSGSLKADDFIKMVYALEK